MAQSTPSLDLTIFDSHNINLLVLGDSSFYPEGFSIVQPTVTITVPGYGEKTATFTARTINLYNSNDLGMTCDVDACDLAQLPDGVYTIKYAVAPAYKYNTTKTFLRVEALYAKFDEQVLNLEMYTCDRQLERSVRIKLDEIEYYIQGAIAAGNRCANKLAIELYRKASKLINQLPEKCN
jgi:hypothetical protein